MADKKPIWRDFKTQKQLEKTIRELVNSKPFNVPFYEPLVSDLIFERHYFCSLIGLRPLQFKKTHENTPYRFFGFFESTGWHAVSWKKSIGKPPGHKDIIDRALRDRVSPLKQIYRNQHVICECCQSAPSEETHHAKPTWKKLMDVLFAHTNLRDMEMALSEWDWFKNDNFSLSDDSPIARYFDLIHSECSLQALCKNCHVAVSRL